ncbi:MAG: uroporphyrinogen-III synthase [Caulobacteraceae bacterium]|nr:uroporphyrinogen-III synthase [Caulobacteraceae bacterium]
MSAGPPKVWITRAQPGADATAARVAALGFQPVVAPLLEVRPLAPKIDLAGVAALAFTSANGVRAFAGLSADRSLPVWAVGEATARTARDAGFQQVRAADGDVASLTQAILRGPPAGPLLHLCAREPAGDLVGALIAEGVQARRTVVYETTPTAVAENRDAAPVADIVLLHSPRAARLLAGLASGGDLSGLRAACLSPAVAAALEGVVPAVSAATPDEPALLDVLRELGR